MNILIVKMSALGDVIHALPALNALRKGYPQSHITWLVEAYASEIVLDHPALDRVLISARKRWLRGLLVPGQSIRTLQDMVAFVRALQEENVLVVPGSGFGGPGYFRIAYCVSDRTIEKALPKFEKVNKKFV